MSTTEPVVVVVPGLRDHVEDHWQTHLARQIPGTLTVAPLTEDKMSLDARVAAIDEVISSVEGDVVLVSHSAGVIMTAHWAARNRESRVCAAFLATPPDLTVELPSKYPSVAELEENGWFPIPESPLPFPVLVATSTNDPLSTQANATRLAEAWGGRTVDLGEVGHLNPASGFGEWPRAIELLNQTLALAGRAPLTVGTATH